MSDSKEKNISILTLKLVTQERTLHDQNNMLAKKVKNYIYIYSNHEFELSLSSLNASGICMDTAQRQREDTDRACTMWAAKPYPELIIIHTTNTSKNSVSFSGYRVHTLSLYRIFFHASWESHCIHMLCTYIWSISLINILLVSSAFSCLRDVGFSLFLPFCFTLFAVIFLIP